MKTLKKSRDSFLSKRILTQKSRSLKFEPLEERQLLAVGYQLFVNEECTIPGLAGSYVNDKYSLRIGFTKTLWSDCGTSV